MILFTTFEKYVGLKGKEVSPTLLGFSPVLSSLMSYIIHFVTKGALSIDIRKEN